MQSQNDPALRQRRHNQLMAMIEAYHLSQEQEEYLDTIKKNTEIQIATRFVKSKLNQHYIFPLCLEQDEEQAEEEEFPRGISFDHTLYDLRTQNVVKNHPKAKIEKTQTQPSRRVKSLGSQKFDDKIMREIKKQLRERPQERGGDRKRVILPSINKNSIIKSQRVLSKHEQKSPKIVESSSLKVIKSKNYQKIRDLYQKERHQKKMGELVGSKLLTQGQDLISFGNTKVLVNKLRVVSPERQHKKPKKLITSQR